MSETVNALAEARSAWAERRLWDAKRLIDRFTGEGPDRVKAHFLSAVIHREIGDLFLAHQEIDSCLTLLAQFTELAPLLRGPAHYNKALIWYHRDQLSEAMDAYREALREFEQEGMTDYRRQALQNLAWTAVEAGDLDLAADCLRESRGLIRSDEARAAQQVAEAYLDWATGHRTEALKSCENIATKVDAGEEIRAFAYVVASYAAADLGMMQEALRLASEAWDLSLKPGMDSRTYTVARKARQFAHQAIVAQRGTGA